MFTRFLPSLCTLAAKHLPHRLHIHHTTPAAKPMTTTTPYNPHPHVADVEVAGKRFHVSATSSDDARRLQRCCQDMEAFFSSLLIGNVIAYHSPTLPHNPIHA